MEDLGIKSVLDPKLCAQIRELKLTTQRNTTGILISIILQQNKSEWKFPPYDIFGVNI